MYNCCSVYNPPSGAGASAVTGSGTLNYVSKWTPNGSTLGNSQIYDNATNVGINNASPTALLDLIGKGSTSATYSFKVQNSTTTTIANFRDDGKVFIGTEPGGTYDSTDKLIVNGTISARNGSSALYLYNDGTAAGLFRYNYGTAAYQNFAIGNTTTQLNLMGRVHLSNTATSTSIRCSMYETDSQGVFIFVAGNNTQNGFRWHDSTDTTPLLFLYDDGTLTAKQAALSTTATDGFWYVPSCAGAPTGVPTARTGTIPIVVDSTNNKMYIYSGGAWVALN